jgi:hypothetical protein
MMQAMKTGRINIFTKCCRRLDRFFFRFTYLDYDDFTLAIKMG